MTVFLAEYRNDVQTSSNTSIVELDFSRPAFSGATRRARAVKESRRAIRTHRRTSVRPLGHRAARRQRPRGGHDLFYIGGASGAVLPPVAAASGGAGAGPLRGVRRSRANMGVAAAMIGAAGLLGALASATAPDEAPVPATVISIGATATTAAG
ncbi:hypothetical protein [Corynebacterium sp. H78]|uniref:hypothetical protein n=1 Tax=Corynebacterium sp. H78 TaxID=3133417 RepID=UPI0030B09872